MNHSTAKHVLLLYGELPEDEARQVRAHLAECEGCRQDYAILAGAREAVDAADFTHDLARPTAELFAAIDAIRAPRAPIPAQREPKRGILHWRYLVPASFAAACAVLALLFLPATPVPRQTPIAESLTRPSSEAPGATVPAKEPPAVAPPVDARPRPAARSHSRRLAATSSTVAQAVSAEKAPATEKNPAAVSLSPRFSESVLDTELHTIRRRVNSLVRYVNSDDF